MVAGRTLPRSFYDRRPEVVARELLGCVVESRTDDGVVGVRLVEVEAYAGESDAASHAWRGPTPRTRVMYGPPGRSYVYFSYGMHYTDTIDFDTVVEGSAVFEGAAVAADAFVRDSVIGSGAVVGSGAHLDGVVVGDRAVIGAGNELVRGARVWPDVVLVDTAVRFSSDR